MMATLKIVEASDVPYSNPTTMETRIACQKVLTSVIESTPALLFTSMATVDGRSYAHANAATHTANPQRSAAIMSSLMALTESFSREALNSRALYSSTATEHGSIVIVRVPSKAGHHAFCMCSDASENLGMTIRMALDTASQLAGILDTQA
jgi:predicted regulator of Ras-like GTPase activity (Roadblock/LC7/MglB family)